MDKMSMEHRYLLETQKSLWPSVNTEVCASKDMEGRCERECADKSRVTPPDAKSGRW